MSFSSQTKDELVESCKLGSTEEKRSLLCGITHAAGSMTLGRGGIGLQYITENSSVAALTVRLGRELYSVTAETSISEKERLNAVSNVVKFTGDGVRNLLNDAGYGVDGDDKYGDREFNKANKKYAQALRSVRVELHFPEESALGYLEGKVIESLN